MNYVTRQRNVDLHDALGFESQSKRRRADALSINHCTLWPYCTKPLQCQVKRSDSSRFTLCDSLFQIEQEGEPEQAKVECGISFLQRTALTLQVIFSKNSRSDILDQSPCTVSRLIRSHVLMMLQSGHIQPTGIRIPVSTL